MLELRTGFVDALYPLGCRLCGAALEIDTLSCAAHPLELDRERPRCSRCAAELAPAFPDGGLCPACRREPPRFERALTIGSYRSGLHDWVLAFKHGGRRDLAPALAALLGERLRERGARGLLVPVPLHPLRRFERGYDQAALLAEELARRTGLRTVAALRRRRATRPQGSALALSRAANVRGAFRLGPFARRKLAGQELWLVDDVLTSGSTADECARVLLHAGAVSVGVALVARA
jgi:ComF family protein